MSKEISTSNKDLKLEQQKAREIGLARKVKERNRDAAQRGDMHPTCIVREEDGIRQVSFEFDGKTEHADSAMIAAFGVNNSDFIDEQVRALATFANKPKKSTRDLARSITSSLALISEIAPNDPIEAMLAVQMVTTHKCAMKAIESLNWSESLKQDSVASNSATKLMNLYIRQMEALNKHRGKGQQKMTVEHIHVNEGGQAIIGDVSKGGRG